MHKSIAVDSSTITRDARARSVAPSAPICMAVCLAVAAACWAGSPALASTPLTMSCTVASIGGGQYRYDFRLALDNHDGTWVPGQGWAYLIFADNRFGPSPLPDFQGNVSDLPVGPWDTFTSSVGEHNGPTFDFILNAWIPTSVGQSLSWSGLSTHLVEPSTLKWSSLFVVGGATTVSFELVGGGSSTCPSDFDHDGFVTGDDFDSYVMEFENGSSGADFDGDGFVTGDDFDGYVLAFETGC